MVAKGKRKAQEGLASPAKKAYKRKAADANVDTFESGSEEEEDVGRGESEDLMKAISVIHPKDEVWTKNMVGTIAAHEAELNAAVDEKEQELNTLDRNFQSDMRSLLTDVLGVPSSKPHHEHNLGTSDIHLDPRPGYDHAQLLFAKSERLLHSFAIASEAIENAATCTDQSTRFERDKEDVARLLHLGQEISRRKIQDVLKRPEDDTPRRKRKKNTEEFDEDKLDEAAAIFDALKKKEDQDHEEEEEEADGDTTDVAAGPGLYSILHDAKKGLKRLAGGIIIDVD